MSNNYRWKDKYYALDGSDIAIQGRSLKYVSQLAPLDGDGSRKRPFKPENTPVAAKLFLILSGGFFSTTKILGSSSESGIMFGQGMDKTIIGQLDASYGGSVLYDATVLGGILRYVTFYRCALKVPITSNNSNFTQCILYEHPTIAVSSANNSYVNNEYKLARILGTNSLFCNSDIEIIAADLNRRTTYYAFSNCRFKIANETEYKSLMGNTEEELRADFVARCESQGIVIPKGTEYDVVNLPMYRWVFSNEENNHGNVVRDSIIHKFQNSRYIYFGWNPNPVEEISITSDKTKSKSLSYLDSSGNLILKENTVVLSENLDVSDISKGQLMGVIRSNIIWLGEGKQKLNTINIHHNLAMQYGVMIDRDPSIIPITNGAIKEGEFYLIRSKSAGKETLTYNNQVYSTSLSDKNNIFVGTKNITSWDASDSVIVYKVNDLSVSSTIRMRIVDEIPAQAITKTRVGYWYFIEPKDIKNPQGEVNYKGLKYPALSSFLADTAEDITISGDCYLREAWKDDELDLAFWKDKQKPIWFDVVPDDMRCMLKKNNPLSVEMASDDKGYIASGHPDFYAMVAADNGVSKPAYDITGKYLQIELVISTLNPM